MSGSIGDLITLWSNVLPFEVVQSFCKLFEGIQVNGQLRKFVVTEVRGDWAFQVVSRWTVVTFKFP